MSGNITTPGANPAHAVRLAEQRLGVSEGYSVLHRGRWVKTVSLLNQYCPPKTHPKLLDLGVWPGYQSLALATMGYEVTGLDLDPRRLPTLPFTTQAIDLNRQDSFSVPDQSVDVVVATEIIEHLHPDRLTTCLAAAHQALRPGGYLLITTPNRHHLGAVLRSRTGGTDAEGHGHTREYTAGELRTHIGEAWSSVKIQHVDMYSGIGKINNQHYYRPLRLWWRHPRRLHNAMKIFSGVAQTLIPPVRDTLVIIVQA